MGQMGPKWAIGSHIANYFPIFSLHGNIAKNQSIEFRLIVLIYGLSSANDKKNMCHLKSD